MKALCHIGRILHVCAALPLLAIVNVTVGVYWGLVYSLDETRYDIRWARRRIDGTESKITEIHD